MALTLVQFWQQERDTQESAQTAAQNDLASAQLALLTAKSTLDASVTALNALGADIAANRAKLVTTSVPSEVTALNNAIRDQIIQQRSLQGAIMDEQDAVAWAQADADAASGALTRSTRRLAASEARLSEAKDANKQRQLLKAQLSLPPYDTLQSDANGFSTGAEATDAKAEIDATFPTALQTLAAKRYATRTARAAQLQQSLDDAEAALGAALASAAGLPGAATQKEIDFRRAERALRDYATAAKQRYDRSVSLMKDLQARKKGTKTPDLLTAQEKLDVTASAQRTAAETNVAPLDADRSALYTARNDLDTQIVTQINTDVDALATDPTVKARRDAATAAAGTLKSAQDAIVASGDKKVMDEWEVVVQDAVWRALLDYLDASATLVELKATAPASLGAALDTAEDAYAVALAKATKAQRQADSLSDAIALRARRVEASTAALPGRLLSAVRGDSF